MWERTFRSGEISQRAFQHGMGANMISLGGVMEGDCQLHHALDVNAQRAARRRFARQRAPEVFQDFMGVEEVAAIEQIHAQLELVP